MRFLRFSIISIFIFFTLNHCAGLQELANIREPELAVEDVRVTGFSLQDVELTFDISIDNPNPVSLDLQSYHYDLNIADNSFISGDQVSNTSVPASNKSTIEVPVSFTFSELYDTFQSVRSRDETSYSFLANVDLQLPVLGMISVPVNYEGTLPVVKTPSLSISGFNIDRLTFTQADISVDVEIDNPNAFSMSLFGMDYSININGFSPVTGSVNETRMIAQKSSGVVTIPVSFNLTELGMGAYRILTGDESLNYSLSGNADIGADLPFFDRSEFNFDRSGTLDISR